jgi:circadian clock protein KaiC
MTKTVNEPRTETGMPRMETGVRNLDAIFDGGIPKGAVSVVSGPPGAGKTILTQQICFHAASAENRILYFTTLSEPTAKTLRYLKQFDFFDPKKLEQDFRFVDLGVIIRSDGLAQTSSLIMERLKKVKPAIVVIDSFKAFDDLSKSKEELRKLCYEVAVNLMAWEVTGLLLGEYAPQDYVTNPLFSVIDGLILLSQRESSGEQQRFIQVPKMRGTNQNRDEHPFIITPNGIEVFAPRVTIQRDARAEHPVSRTKTGIGKLDDLLGEGISNGSSLLVSGVAGTGKTVLLLEFLYRGAQAGDKGILFSFEETTERLLATAKGMGWELEREIERGRIELVFIPQPAIMVEEHLLMMREKVDTFGAKRVAVDSISVFLHKVKDPQISREKIFQLASIIQNNGAVGLFATDIPYGSDKLSRFGVEETVVDGVILLSSTEEGFERQRYLEVYKLRNTAHLKGRHAMAIAKGGIQVYPRYTDATVEEAPPAPLAVADRLPTGIPGMDALLGGGLLKRSATLVAGSAGIGKSTFGLQFILEGAARKEPGVIFTLEESPQQVLATSGQLQLPLRKWTEKGMVEVVYLPKERVRTAQFLAVFGDRIRRLKARRVLLDGVTHFVRESKSTDDLRQTLYNLVRDFKSLDVTCVLTVETKSLYFADGVTDEGLSPVADNLLMLRYVEQGGELSPALRVVKTRGSTHKGGTYPFTIGQGGIRILEGETGSASPRAGRRSARRRPLRKKG